jgi:hypothetical protein
VNPSRTALLDLAPCFETVCVVVPAVTLTPSPAGSQSNNVSKATDHTIVRNIANLVRARFAARCSPERVSRG